MAFGVTCPTCSKAFSITDEIYQRKVSGRVVTIKCKQCQAGIRVDATKPGDVKISAAAKEAPADKAIETKSVGPLPPQAVAPAVAPAPRVRQATLIGGVATTAGKAAAAAAAAAPPPPLAAAPAPAPAPTTESLWAVEVGDGQDRELPLSELGRELERGRIPLTALVWREGMAEWLEAKQVPELAGFVRKAALAKPTAKPAPAPRAAPPAPAAPAPKAAPPPPRGAPPPMSEEAPTLPRDALKRGSISDEAPTQPKGAPPAPRARMASAPGLVPKPPGPPPAGRLSAPDALPPPPVAPPALRKPPGPPLAEPAPAPAASPFAEAPAASPFAEAPAASPFAEAPAASPFAETPAPAPAVAPAPTAAPAPLAPAPVAAAPPAPTPTPPRSPFELSPSAATAPAPQPLAAAPAPRPAVQTFATPGPVTASADIELPPVRSKAPLVIALVGVAAAAAAAFFLLRGNPDPAAGTLTVPTPEAASTATTKPTATSTAATTATATGGEPTAGGTAATSPGAGFAELFATGARHAEGGATEAAARFDAAVAKKSLAQVLPGVTKCKEPGGPRGQVSAVVAFETNGKVSTVTISEPPFAGTSTATCLASVLKQASMPPFKGLPGTVSQPISLR